MALCIVSLSMILISKGCHLRSRTDLKNMVMRKEEALVRYKKKVEMHILKYYEDAEEYQWFNVGDADLHPIRTRLPECPDWHKVENFGLPKEKQVFKREEMPSILEYLIKKTR